MCIPQGEPAGVRDARTIEAAVALSAEERAVRDAELEDRAHASDDDSATQALHILCATKSKQKKPQKGHVYTRRGELISSHETAEEVVGIADSARGRVIISKQI